MPSYSGQLGRSRLGRLRLGFSAPPIPPPPQVTGFTGVLGESSLGSFMLGEYDVTVVGLNARVTQTAVEFIYTAVTDVRVTQVPWEILAAYVPAARVTQTSIELLYTKGVAARITQGSWEVLMGFVPKARVTQTAVEVLLATAADARITQTALEVVFVADSDARVTQTSIEVLYQYIAPTDINLTTAIAVAQTIGHSSEINRTVSHAIAVSQVVGGGSYVETVISPVLVTQHAEGLNSTVNQTVTTAITVGQTVGAVNTAVNVSVTQNITVTQTIAERNNVNHQSVFHSIGVSQTTISEGGHTVLEITVTDNITVNQNPFGRNNNVRLTVVTAINVSVPTSEHDDQNRQTVTDNIGVTQTIVGHDNTTEVEVTDHVTVTQTIDVFNPNIALMSNVTVGQVAFGRNDNIRISVTDNVSVSQTIVQRDDTIRMAVIDNVAVDDIGRSFINPRRMSVTDHITVPTNYPNPVAVRVSPVLITVWDQIQVTTDVEGGSSSREMAVADHVTVSDAASAQQIYFHMEDRIFVTQSYIGGNDHRIINVHDAIVVSDSPQGFINPRRMSVQDNIIVSTTRTLPPPQDIGIVNTAVHVNQTVTPRIVPVLHIEHHIEVVDAIINRSLNNNQAVRHDIQVTQSLRSSPVYITVLQPIVVDQRIQQLEIEVHQRIVVGSNFYKTFDADITDSLTLDDSLVAHMSFEQIITQNVPIADNVVRGAEWFRTMIDHVRIFEGSYPKYIDFLDDPVWVPVAVGTLVTNYVTLETKSSIITLPAPQLNDERGHVSKMLIQRSMNGGTLALKQSSSRQKLKYIFRVDKAKAFELRAFLESQVSQVVKMTTWDAQIWLVYVTNNPFELQNAGRSAPADEYSTIELELEGTKLSG